MNFRLKKTWVAALGLALAASTAGGVALAYGAEDGGVATSDVTLPDPNQTAVALKLYDGSGNVVTSGSTTAPLAVVAAADGVVRANDEYASLFVHLPQSSAAPGDWPGLQVTGTDKYAGAGAITVPGAPAGKPFVRTTAAGYTLADVKQALPNNETGASFVGVYELRLRTSSASAGVSDQYAAAYVKITGTTWAITTAPVLGGGGNPPQTPVGTSVSATWPAALTYGAGASVSVTVNQASGANKPTGTVRLVSGSTTLGTATLSGGAATLTLAPTALTPGSKALKVVYPGVANAFNASESSTKTITVAKAAPGKPTYKTTKAPTSKKKGTATVTVPTPAGLATAGGTASVVLKKGSSTKTIKITIVNGTATVKLPKLAPGKWTVTVTYDGNANYLTATSKSYKLKVKKAT